MASWRVTIDFIDEDGEEEFEEIDVEARTEELAIEKAKDVLDGMHDVEEIEDVEARLL